MATITEYDFTQQVDYPSVLVANIQASSISVPLISVETDGSGPTMAVTVWFSDVLSSADQTTLTGVMSAYVNSLPPLQEAQAKVAQDISFGMKLIVQFGAANRLAGLSTGQVVQIAQQLAPIQALLSSGSIETALYLIQNLTPNSLISQDVINTYVQEIQNYLNS